MSAMDAMYYAISNGCSGYPGVQGNYGSGYGSRSGSGSGSRSVSVNYYSDNCRGNNHYAKNSSGIGLLPSVSRGSVPINKAGL